MSFVTNFCSIYTICFLTLNSFIMTNEFNILNNKLDNVNRELNTLKTDIFLKKK